MASYKVLQDIEAEDKLLGPLTLRQFIYGGVAGVTLYFCYFLATHGATFLAIPFLPVAAIGAFFAFPWGRDQPTEVWALAKVRFALKPRRRIWDQSGTKELVTITVPKQIAVDYTNGLSQSEVRSRLRALATTVDSRGWAIKNTNVNLSASSALGGVPQSDRLVGPTTLPQPIDETDVQAADDILDEKNNASAQRLDSLISQSAREHRDRIVQNLQGDNSQPAPANNYWFLNQPGQAAQVPNGAVTFNTQVVTPGMPQTQTAAGPAPVIAPAEEANIVAELETHKKEAGGATFFGHLHSIQPLSAQPQAAPVATPPQVTPVPAAPQAPAPNAQTVPTNAAAAPPQTAPLNGQATPVPPPVTPATQAAILKLASNDDLDVATIAREAERTAAQDEVVIKLH